MGFKNLFWAFIFIFDFRLNGFDILPDIVACILFYKGLKILSDRNENFEKGRVLAIPLICLSILDFFPGVGNSLFGELGVLIGIVNTIISLMMIYRICMGITEEARVINDNDLELKSSNRWKWYVIIKITLLVPIIIPSLPQLLFILIFILSIAALLLMIELMNIASNRLE